MHSLRSGRCRLGLFLLGQISHKKLSGAGRPRKCCIESGLQFHPWQSENGLLDQLWTSWKRYRLELFGSDPAQEDCLEV